MTGATTGQFTQFLLGLCAGALLAMAAAMLRAPRPAARWTGFAFFLTSACFAFKLWCDETGALPQEWRLPLGMAAMSSVGWFWLMVLALFEDRDEYRPTMFLAPAGLAALAFVHALPPGPFLPTIWVGLTFMQGGLAVASLIVVVRSWGDDLVESRRQVRGPFMIAVALYILSLSGFDLWELVGEAPAWYPMFNATMLTLCVLAGAVTFLEARGAMFGEAETSAVRPTAPAAHASKSVQALSRDDARQAGSSSAVDFAIDRATRVDLDRLQTLMVTEQVWKEEGLTIASLAVRAGMPETQLRRLVSDCLGYRNFPSYVNAHRIAAAKDRLADPREARVSISTIAYETGFASLGPFNRAFRQEAGVSPSEWRRKALEMDSPIPAPA